MGIYSSYFETSAIVWNWRSIVKNDKWPWLLLWPLPSFPGSLYYCRTIVAAKPLNALGFTILTKKTQLNNHKDNVPFYVITGGPGVGKTTLLEELGKMGVSVVPEIARELIREQRDVDGDALPWKDKQRYMEMMFQRSVESFERTLDEMKGNVPVFFDRGFLDALCYAALEGIAVHREMKTLAETLRYRSDVFILPPWKDIYETDQERKQDWNEAVFTYNKMIQTYRGYQYDLVEVPRATVQERASFVLNFIKGN